MDITFPDKISRAEALIMLWNHTNPQGMGYMHSHQAPSVDDAEEFLSNDTYVDYFRGKPIKTNFETYPNLCSGGYDRDAGNGMMQKVVNNTAEFIGSSPELTETQKSQLIKACDSSVSLSMGFAKDR